MRAADMGHGEDDLIERLVGETDYLSTELTLLQQRHELAEEELEHLHAHAQWRGTLARLAAEDPDLDPERLALAIAVSDTNDFSAGEVVVLDPDTLQEPFGARRVADPSAVELFGHDTTAARSRSEDLTTGGRSRYPADDESAVETQTRPEPAPARGGRLRRWLGGGSRWPPSRSRPRVRPGSR